LAVDRVTVDGKAVLTITSTAADESGVTVAVLSAQYYVSGCCSISAEAPRHTRPGATTPGGDVVAAVAGSPLGHAAAPGNISACAGED